MEGSPSYTDLIWWFYNALREVANTIVKFTGSFHARGLQFLLFPGDGIHLLEKKVCSLPKGAVRCRRKYFNAPFSSAFTT